MSINGLASAACAVAIIVWLNVEASRAGTPIGPMANVLLLLGAYGLSQLAAIGEHCARSARTARESLGMLHRINAQLASRPREEAADQVREWVVRGAHRRTGHDLRIVVPATTRDEAIAEANAREILVQDVEPYR